MDSHDAALFELPEPPAEVADIPPRRGRARETYRRTTVVDVQVTHPAELRDAALSTFDNNIIIIGPVIEPDGEPGVTDDDPDMTDEREEITTSIASALSWVVEPTHGLWELMETGVIHLADASIEVEELDPSHCRVTWSTAIKLVDAQAFHEHAAAAGGDTAARAEAERSVSAAWGLAADPYAPIRDVPAIVWSPRSVRIEQVFARQSRTS